MAWAHTFRTWRGEGQLPVKKTGSRLRRLGRFLAQACVHAQPPRLCLTLRSMDCSVPASSVPWILQARILAWVAVPSSRIKPPSPASPALLADSLTHRATWEPNVWYLSFFAAPLRRAFHERLQSLKRFSGNWVGSKVTKKHRPPWESKAAPGGLLMGC